ncbi:MAG: hypothetical protein ACUVTM_05020 [Candidatus Bathyarchaeia archaeon]
MSTRNREYYRRYMKEYYQKHKDYWRRYYLERKGLLEGKVVKRNRRAYLERIRAIWTQSKPRRSPLIHILKKIGGAKPEEPTVTEPTRQAKVETDIDLPERLRETIIKILEVEGFHNIECPEYIPTSKGRKPSTLQALAHKGEGKCIVEVVTAPFKVYTPKRREYLKAFLRFFNAKYYLCFLKPNLSRYHLLEMDPFKIKSVSLGLKAIAAMKPTPP